MSASFEARRDGRATRVLAWCTTLWLVAFVAAWPRQRVTLVGSFVVSFVLARLAR